MVLYKGKELKKGSKITMIDWEGNIVKGKILRVNENGTYSVKTATKIIFYVAPSSFI